MQRNYSPPARLQDAQQPDAIDGDGPSTDDDAMDEERDPDEGASPSPPRPPTAEDVLSPPAAAATGNLYPQRTTPDSPDLAAELGSSDDEPEEAVDRDVVDDPVQDGADDLDDDAHDFLAAHFDQDVFFEEAPEQGW